MMLQNNKKDKSVDDIRKNAGLDLSPPALKEPDINNPR
jgi:hypothetical protein